MAGLCGWWPWPKALALLLVACAGEPPDDLKILAREAIPLAAVRAEPPRAGSPDLVEIAGRCFDVETGEAAAGVRLRLRGKNAYPRWDPGERWSDPPATASGPDGGFELSFAPRAFLKFVLEVVDPDWLGDEFHWHELLPGQRIELGRVPVRRLHRAEVRVVDPDGNLLQGILLRAWLEDPRVAWRVLGDTHARSGPDGRARFEHGLPHGRVRFWLAGGAAAPGHGSFLHAPGAPPPDVVVEPAPVVLSGVLADSRDMPIEGVRIAMIPSESSTSPSSYSKTLADAGGAFTFSSLDPTPRGWTLSASTARGETLAPATGIPTGTRDLRLHLVRYAIALDVVDGRDGSAVESFAVECEPADPGAGGRADTPLERDGQGRVLLGGLHPGSWEVVVHPLDAALAQSRTPVTILAGDTTAALDVELQPCRILPLRVTPAGGPVAGAHADLLAGAPLQDSPQWLDAVPAAPLRSHWPHFEPRHFGAGVTDADGRAELRCATPGKVTVRVRAPGFLPILRAVPFDGEELDVELERGVQLTCQLGPPGILGELVRIPRGFSPIDVPPTAGARLSLLRGRRTVPLVQTEHEVCTVPGLEPGEHRLGLEIHNWLRAGSPPNILAE